MILRWNSLIGLRMTVEDLNGPTRMREAYTDQLIGFNTRYERHRRKAVEKPRSEIWVLTLIYFQEQLSLAIGGGKIAVSPLKMAKAYAVFANRDLK